MQNRSLESTFGPLFAAGLADVNFTVRKGPDLTVESLTREVLQFQDAIDSGRVTQVASVD